MAISALQFERSKYAPKLPKALQGPVKVVVGKETESVADQDEETFSEYLWYATHCL